VILAIILTCISIFIYNNQQYNTYVLSDFGVTLKAKKDFVTQKVNSSLLNLYNEETEMTVNAKYLGDSFWKEDDMDKIMDEYIRLISAMKYDSNIDNVSFKKEKVGFREVGIVEMTTYDTAYSSTVLALLTHKDNGYLAIEVYGPTDVMQARRKEAEKVLKSVRFGKNNHDYSLDRRTSSGEKAAKEV
jgi:hypothetical protein